MRIDWSKAPEWAIAHALQATSQGIQEVWVGEDKYQQLRFEKSFPYGGTVGSDSYHNPRRYQFAFETLRPAPWTGEGLPPVGTVCEFKANILGWVEATITAATEMSIVFTRPSYQNGRPLVEERLPHKAIERFRPIRTPEQIAADQYEIDAEEIAKILSGLDGADNTFIAKTLLDCGYSRKVTP